MTSGNVSELENVIDEAAAEAFEPLDRARPLTNIEVFETRRFPGWAAVVWFSGHVYQVFFNPDKQIAKRNASMYAATMPQRIAALDRLRGNGRGAK